MTGAREAAIEARCAESVSSGGRWPTYRPCGRPVKADGKCGIHLRVEQNEADRQARYTSERETEAANVAKADRAIAALAAVGVKSHRHFDALSRRTGYTGSVVISAEDAERLSAYREGAVERVAEALDAHAVALYKAARLDVSASVVRADAYGFAQAAIAAVFDVEADT